MISDLERSGVPTTKLSLEGLSPADLNTMVADATSMLPRLCKPLSRLVFEKTKGNPLFVREFMLSLQKGSLLTYSLHKKTWVWDNDGIRAEGITDNVLQLLTNKMTSFTEEKQAALKVLSCFGTRVDGVVVEYLILTKEYAGFQEWLDVLVNEGCVQKLEATSDFRFVHDKVRLE